MYMYVCDYIHQHVFTLTIGAVMASAKILVSLRKVMLAIPTFGVVYQFRSTITSVLCPSPQD